MARRPIAAAALFVSAVAAAMGCRLYADPDHCANRSGDRTCADLYGPKAVCSACEGRYNGCTSLKVSDECLAPAGADQSMTGTTGPAITGSTTAREATGTATGGTDVSETGATTAVAGTTSTGDEEPQRPELPGTREVLCEGAMAADLQGEVFITSDQAGENLRGYRRLTGNVDIRGVTNVDFLACMETISGSLTIHDSAVEDLAGLTNLRNVGALRVIGNPELVHIYGAYFLTNLGAIEIRDNAALLEIDGPDAILSVGDTDAPAGVGLVIEDNPILRVVAGFTNLSTIATDLSIARNSELIDVSGLHDLVHVGGQIVVRDNPWLCESQVVAGLGAVPSANAVDRSNLSGNRVGC